MIGVAEGWLNTQWMYVQISLTRSPILEYKSDRSGRRLNQYHMSECADQANWESNTRLQEW